MIKAHKTLNFIMIFLACAALAGCKWPWDSKPEAPQKSSDFSTLAPSKDTSVDISGILGNTTAIRGGKILVRPSNLVLLSPVFKGTASDTIQLYNDGDQEIKNMTIHSPEGASSGFTTSGTCGKILPVHQTCDLVMNYKDTTGRGLTTFIVVDSDAKQTPSVQINVRIDVQSPPLPPVIPCGSPGEPASCHVANPQKNGIDPAYLRALAAAQAARQNSNKGLSPSSQSGGAIFANPRIETRTTDPRYDPDQIPWTETSLPVNRHNILTATRTIPALLDSGISSLLCNQVYAHVEQDVYSDEGVNVLIPHGTKLMGHCGKFTDERVSIQWYRMITPMGVNITFTKNQAETADMMGRGGVPGITQQRGFDRYAAPFLISAIDMSSAIAEAALGSGSSVSISGISGTTQQSENKYSRAIEDYNSNAKNTLEQAVTGLLDQRRAIFVAAGSRIEVQLTEDIYFKKPSEVVKLADYEYEIKKNAHRPQAVEQEAPTFNLVPQISGAPAGADTIQIGGQTYTVQPASGAAPTRSMAAGAESSQGMHQGADPNSAFFRTPQYSNTARGQGSNGNANTNGMMNGYGGGNYNGGYGINSYGNNTTGYATTGNGASALSPTSSNPYSNSTVNNQ